MHYMRTAWALREHYMHARMHAHACPRKETQLGRKGGNHPTFMQASQGSSSPWWLVAVQFAVPRVCWKMVAAFWGHTHFALTQLGPKL